MLARHIRSISPAPSPNLAGLRFEEGNVTLAGDALLTLVQDTAVNVGISRTATIEIPIVGSGFGLIVAGGGILKLSAASTYSGTTRLNGGTIHLGRDSVSSGGVVATGPLGTGGLVVGTGTLSSDSATARSLANPLTIVSSVTLGAPSNNSPNVGALTLSGAVDLGGMGAFAPLVFIYSPVTITGTISNGRFMKYGFGSLTLTGANTYAGGTAFGQTGGTIQIGSSSVASGDTIVSGPLGTGEIVFNFNSTLCSDSTTARSLANPIKLHRTIILGNAVNNGALVFYGPIDLAGLESAHFSAVGISSPVTFNGVISNGGLSLGGPGPLTITGSNTYAGGTSISTSAKVRVGRDSISSNGVIVSGPLGTGELFLNGGATLSSDSEAARSLANSVRIESSFTFGDAANPGPLTLSGPIEINGIPVSLTINSPVTLSGVISGRGSPAAGLRTSGPGPLTLTGANTYASGTTILSGTLIVGGASALGTGNVTVNSGGTLVFQPDARYRWRLASLTTQGTGPNLITLSGNARLEANSAALALNFDSVAGPTSGNAFWNAVQAWTIVSGSSLSTIWGAFSVDNSAWSSVGSFALAQSGNDLRMTWTPVPKPLAFSAQPVPQITASGGTVVYAVTATGIPTPTYQWYRNGTAITGATSALLVLRNASAADAGTYTCVATSSAGSLTSAASTLVIAPTANAGRLINLSILGPLAAGETMAMGTVLGGAGTSGTKSILARAVGPSLAAFAVGNPLPDPKMSLLATGGRTSTAIANNDNWSGDTTLSSAFAQVGAFGYANAATKDAALFQAALNSGNYVVQVNDATSAPGTVLAELYDATPVTDYKATTARLINVSVNKQIVAGSSLTAGFVIGGETARTVLIRAVGPGLGPFMVAGAMPDPKLDLYGQTGTVLASNDSWGGGLALTTAMQSVGAFNIANGNSTDAVLLLTLAPGNYSVRVQPSGTSPGGVALVEVYEVP